MAPHIHTFNVGENKVDKIFNWLKNWIILSLECAKIHYNDFLPSKGDLACHIGVSQGTIQSVFRLLENEGYIESKQKIGSYIKDNTKTLKIEKLTSKRELAVELIKKYIFENNFQKGEKLTSIRKLSMILGVSNTTLRTAINQLVNMDILKKENKDFIIKKTDINIKKITPLTLVEKTAQNLNLYINSNLKEGDRLPSSKELAAIFHVSAKTIHDAIKQLSKDGLLYSRRGQYGTVVLGNTFSTEKFDTYSYEKIELKLRNYIQSNSEIGAKLPSIKEFAKTFTTSEKTVKKALNNLAEEGYVTFSRGRYGGTFVLDIPQSSKEAYKWIAINSDYISDN